EYVRRAPCAAGQFGSSWARTALCWRTPPKGSVQPILAPDQGQVTGRTRRSRAPARLRQFDAVRAVSRRLPVNATPRPPRKLLERARAARAPRAPGNVRPARG